MVLLVSLDQLVYRGYVLKVVYNQTCRKHRLTRVALEHRALLVHQDLVDFQDHLASLVQMDLMGLLEREVHQALQGVQDYLACLVQRVLLAKKETRVVLVSLDCLVLLAIPAREVLGVHQVCQE